MSTPLAKLIEEGAVLHSLIETNSKRLKEITAELSRLAPGEHHGEMGTACAVIAPAPTINPDATAIEAAREIAGEEVFKKLFDRVSSFKPVKAFRDMAAVLLPKAKARKLIALCEKPGTPYVKWS